MTEYRNVQKNTSIKQKKRFKLGKNIGAWCLLLPSVFCVYFLVIRPQLQGVFLSFFNMKGFTPTKFVGLENYKRVISDSVFATTFVNTWEYVLWSLVIGLAVPFVTAIVMNELVHMRKTIRTIVYLPGIMPAVAVSLLWYFIYYPDVSGLLNSFLVRLGMQPYEWLQDGRFTILYIIISMTWSGMGGTAIYYFAAMQGISRELYEAAVVDGAGYFRRIWVVTIPQMAGMLALFGIKQCINVFNVMEQPMQMTGGGPNNASMTLGYLSYQYAFSYYKPQLALALGVIMFIVLIVFAMIYYKMDKKISENQM